MEKTEIEQSDEIYEIETFKFRDENIYKYMKTAHNTFKFTFILYIIWLVGIIITQVAFGFLGATDRLIQFDIYKRIFVFYNLGIFIYFIFKTKIDDIYIDYINIQILIFLTSPLTDFIILSFFYPWNLIILSKVIGIFVGPVYFCLLIVHILLIDISVRIKKERSAPIKEQKLQNQSYENKINNYTKLIEKCGMKFFIKYYDKINILPLRDVEIIEDYSQKEKEERLRAAKKIIDLHLTEFVLKQILDNYSDMLSLKEIKKQI